MSIDNVEPCHSRQEGKRYKALYNKGHPPNDQVKSII